MVDRPVATIESIDWRQPWWRDCRGVGASVAAAPDWLSAVNNEADRLAIRHAGDKPLRFVPQDKAMGGLGYEAHIARYAEVPTRNNLHDFFNAQMWLTYPRIKAQLNRFHQQILDTAPTGTVRGHLRDRATVFDESGAIVLIADNDAGRAIGDALSKGRWHELFVQAKDAFGALVDVRLFGHAVMEKLVSPYKAITAHALVQYRSPQAWPLSTVSTQEIDYEIAAGLQAAPQWMDRFQPLPIAGIPGWWRNQDPDFYADVSVFRPRRG